MLCLDSEQPIFEAAGHRLDFVRRGCRRIRLAEQTVDVGRQLRSDSSVAGST